MNSVSPIRNVLQRTFKFRSFRQSLFKVAKEPMAIILEAIKGPMVSSSYLLSRTFNIDHKAIYTYFGELYKDADFWGHIMGKINEAKKAEQQVAGWISIDLMPYIYVLTRIYRPKIFIETGVGPGGSSAVILRALEKNGIGKLYSIDSPDYDQNYYPTIGKDSNIYIPKGFNTGWLIPPHLRGLWTLILGDSKMELPKLLHQHEIIDMFMHDSLHTYEHMMFEYINAWNYLAKGGLLLSDDVNYYWNIAFIDFCRAKKIAYCSINNRLGIAKK